MSIAEIEFPCETSSNVAKSSTNSAKSDVETQIPETSEKAGEAKRDIHGIRWIMTVCAILSCVFMFALDTTVVRLKLHTIVV